MAAYFRNRLWKLSQIRQSAQLLMGIIKSVAGGVATTAGLENCLRARGVARESRL